MTVWRAGGEAPGTVATKGRQRTIPEDYRYSSPKWRQGDVPQRELRGGLAWRHRPISGSGIKWIDVVGPSGAGGFDATLAENDRRSGKVCATTTSRECEDPKRSPWGPTATFGERKAPKILTEKPRRDLW